MRYEYHVNLDERGEFYADVRDAKGCTVFEIHGHDIFDDGFMAHGSDVKGLEDYLIALDILKPNDYIV